MFVVVDDDLGLGCAFARFDVEIANTGFGMR